MNPRDFTLISPSAKKAVSLADFQNDSLWKETTYDTQAARNKQADVAKSIGYRNAIGTLYRCIDLRSAAVSSIPFIIFQGDLFLWQEKPF